MAKIKQNNNTNNINILSILGNYIMQKKAVLFCLYKHIKILCVSLIFSTESSSQTCE